MKWSRKTTASMILIVILLVLVGQRQAVAVTPGLYLVDGNPSCATLFEATVLSGPDTSLADLGPLFGLKYDTNPTGDVSHSFTTDGSWVVTNGPQDPNNSVSIFNVILSGSEGVQFDWSATMGIDAVIVKAQDANVYVYTPEQFGASGLMAPEGRAVSHIEFCYDYELTASKTANAEFTRTFSWDITKDFDGEYWMFIGEDTIHDYEVSVDQTVVDSDFSVSGTITVFNPTPFPVTFSVSDLVDGTPATVLCPTNDLASNDGAAGGLDEVTCTYSVSLAGAVDGTNVATVTSENLDVKGATASADYAFGDPTTIVGHPTINVSDTNGGLGTAGGDKTWNYTKDFVCPTDVSMYTDGVYTFSHPNTATIDETGQSDDANVIVHCYAPVVSKNASTAFTRKFDWSITKDFDATFDKFIGDPATTHGYKVTVDQTVTESDFAVSGAITVQNPHPLTAMLVSLSDFVDGNPALLDCGGSLNVPAGGSAVCNYSADLLTKTDGTNTATATFNSIDFQASANYAFGEPTTIVGEPTINVDDTNGSSWSTSGDDSWEYTKDFVCPTDTSLYVDGFFSFTHPNTATIRETGQSDDALVTVNCYAPVVSKTADTEYTREFRWTITKDDDGEFFKFIGDPASTHGYTVTVDQTVVEDEFAVVGSITVQNPNPMAAMNVSLSDAIDGNPASLDCGGALVVPAGGSASCDYDATLLTKTDGTNTATATLNNIDFQASANFAFGEPTSIVGFEDINVSDTNGMTWQTSGDDSWNYTKDFVCPTDASVYVDGVFNFTHDNTATIDETGQSDDASVTVHCYAPVVSKTAAGTFDERHTWNIDKTVDPELQNGYPGDDLSWTWTVDVTESSADENFDITGTITVQNPNPMAAMDVTLTDSVNGTPASLDCGGVLNVAAGSSATCDYQLLDQEYGAVEAAPTTNSAKVTFNTFNFNALAGISWTANVIDGSADVTDDKIGLNETIFAGNGPWSWSAKQNHVCSWVWADYGADGAYDATLVNQAFLIASDGFTDDAQASTTYLCEAGTVDLLKLTNGAADPSMVWNFTLRGPGVDVSAATPPAYIDFGMPVLRPAEAAAPNIYTVCEIGVPAGWTSMWVIDANNNGVFDDGDTVMPFVGAKTGNLFEVYDPTFGEPNVVNDKRCVDFTVSTGATFGLIVDNQSGGGAPRTPGYWKNWSFCSGGNQYATAQSNGGADEGWWTLDDLLPQYVGPVVLPRGDINDPNYCEDIGQPAINILNMSTLEGKKKANDAAYNLATHLMAAKLNLSAGACVPTAAQLQTAGIAMYDGSGFYTDIHDLVADADALLGNIEVKKNQFEPFDGLGDFLGPKNKSDQRQEAFYLAGLLDDYNNGLICTGDETH